MEPLRPAQKMEIIGKYPEAGADLEEYERLLGQRFARVETTNPVDEERINQLYEKLFGSTTNGVADSTMNQDEVIPPAPTHKWCDIHQDAILASRGFYRLSATLMLLIICLQKWDSGTSIWIMLPVGFFIWRLHQFAGQKVEEQNYLHAEDKWNKAHGEKGSEEHDL